MSSVPAQVSMLLQNLTAELPVILGKNLIGIYLYGSLTQRAFNPERSDVDCIVVTEQDLSDTQFKRLDGWLARASKANPWVSRVQMSLVGQDRILTMDPKACVYQFGLLKRSGWDGNPIVWINVLKSGVILLGPRPQSFVPTITPEILFQGLTRELGYLREEISDNPDSEWRDVPKYRAYAVLTVCRILYSFKTGTIVSKARAARWAIRSVPEEWREMVHRALDTDAGKRSVAISLPRIARFIAFADTELHPVSNAVEGDIGRHQFLNPGRRPRRHPHDRPSPRVDVSRHGICGARRACGA